MTDEASVYRKITNRLLVGTFILVLCLPTVDRVFNIDPSMRLAESRSLNKAPEWPTTRHQVATFAQQYERYWNDSFGFRRLLIRCNSWAQYQFGVSSTPLAVIGKKGWLYYAGDSSMEAYQGLTSLSTSVLEAWRIQLEARENLMLSRGGHFLFVVAPNKQTTYSDEVPDRYVRSPSTLTDQLVEYLALHSKLKILDLRQPLNAAKAKGEVFWRTDSHWNDRGMYVGYVEVLNRLRQWYPRLVPLREADFGQVASGDFSGDLSALLGLVGIAIEKRVDWNPKRPWQVRLVVGDVPKPPASSLYSDWDGPDPTLPRAVIFHDSYWLPPALRNIGGRTDAYANLDSPFDPVQLLAGHFSHAFFTWQFAFDRALVERERADIVIEEVVERSLAAGPR